MQSDYQKIINGVDIILPEETFEKRFIKATEDNVPLKVKLGFDPTSPDLHLGHFVVLKKLREFQELGHEIHIIIGSFTAMIGDPTGKNVTRPPLSKEDVLENSTTYIDQLSRVLDVSKITVHNNGEWFKEMSSLDIQDLFASYTVNKLLTRDDFSKRIKRGVDIAAHELMYPLLQGYDSFQIKSDIEIGGTDQLFNMQVGRRIQESKGARAQHIICMPILRGLDGVKKMSKSLNNYIGLTETTDSILEKIMSLPENVLSEYITLIVDMHQDEKVQLELLISSDSGEVRKIIADNIAKQLS